MTCLAAGICLTTWLWGIPLEPPAPPSGIVVHKVKTVVIPVPIR